MPTDKTATPGFHCLIVREGVVPAWRRLAGLPEALKAETHALLAGNALHLLDPLASGGLCLPSGQSEGRAVGIGLGAGRPRWPGTGFH